MAVGMASRSSSAKSDGQLPISRGVTQRAAGTPWASHFEQPEQPAQLEQVQRDFEGRRGSRGGTNSRNRMEQSTEEAYLGDERLSSRAGSAGSRQAAADGDGDWKRPRTLAPPWAAGGGQEMLLSSPAQGRKVSFVLGKPAFYNVEDAPSAVLTSKSERTWTPGDGLSRPSTPAAPPVLRLPAGASSRPQTPTPPAPSQVPHRRPTGRPGTGRPPPAERESIDHDGDSSMSANSSYNDPRASAASPGAGGESDTPALQFVKQAESALLVNDTTATPAPAHGGGLREGATVLGYPGAAAMDNQRGGSSVAEQAKWSTAPSPRGRGKDAYVVEKKRVGGRTPRGGREDKGGVGRGSVTDRGSTREKYLSASQSMKSLKEGEGGGAQGVRGSSAPRAKLGPERASARVSLQKKVRCIPFF